MATTQIAFGKVGYSFGSGDVHFMVADRLSSATTQTITPTGSNQQSTAVAPAIGERPAVRIATDTAVYIAIGANPDATAEPRLLMPANSELTVICLAGDKVGVVTAPAGSAIIGKVGIDQTTPGTTNGVVIAPSSAAAVGIAPICSTALETGHVLKASAGNLYGLEVMSTTVAGMVLIFDSTTVPAAGAVTPKKAYSLPANSTLVVGFDPPLYCATGISVAFSSNTATPFTKTDSTTAFISGEVA